MTLMALIKKKRQLRRLYSPSCLALVDLLTIVAITTIVTADDKAWLRKLLLSVGGVKRARLCINPRFTWRQRPAGVVLDLRRPRMTLVTLAIADEAVWPLRSGTDPARGCLDMNSRGTHIGPSP